MKIRVVIIDDEKPAIDELVFLLANYSQVEIIGTAVTGKEGLELILSQLPDLIFLDIEMPEMTGLELAQRLGKISGRVRPRIVFTSAYDEFALHAFEVEAYDYLLKPVSEERLEATLSRVQEWLARDQQVNKEPVSSQPVYRIPVEHRGRYKLLSVDEVLFIFTEGGEVQVKTRELTYNVNASLTELEKNLKQEGFFRCHRSYIVNLNRVDEVIPWFKGKYLLVMDDPVKTEIPVSRTYIKDLRRIFHF